MTLSDHRVMKSYVWFDNQCFYVSTVNLAAPADGKGSPAGLFSETMVWRCNFDTHEVGECIYTGADDAGSIDLHLSVCDLLNRFGQVRDPEVPANN